MPLNGIKIQKALQLFAVATFLFAWANSVTGAVLCVCEDGHVAIENIYTGPCDHSHGPEADYDHELSHGCSDTSLSLETLNSESSRDFDFSHINQESKSLWIPSKAISSQSSKQLAIDFSQDPDPNRKILKTVILTI